MKKLIIILLLLPGLLLGGSYLSDETIAKLTLEELIAVKKAFEQSSYYRYYQSLADGKDQIKVTKIRKVKQEVIGKNKLKIMYVLSIDLIISGTIFKREMPWEILATITIPEDPKNIMSITVGTGFSLSYTRKLFRNLGLMLQVISIESKTYLQGGISLYF